MKVSEFKTWRKQRAQGRMAFIKKTGVFYWSWPMFVLMTFVIPPQGVDVWSQPITFFIIQFVIWTSGGVLFGACLWFFNEWRFSNQIKMNK